MTFNFDIYMHYLYKVLKMKTRTGHTCLPIAVCSSLKYSTYDGEIFYQINHKPFFQMPTYMQF